MSEMTEAIQISSDGVPGVGGLAAMRVQNYLVMEIVRPVIVPGISLRGTVVRVLLRQGAL